MHHLDSRHDAETSKGFYVSADDLIRRCDIAEMRTLFAFVAARLGVTRSPLPKSAGSGRIMGSEGSRLPSQVAGSRFKVMERFTMFTRMEIVLGLVAYYVDIDPGEQRRAHPVYGSRNGILRFYGPWWEQLAGAHIDAGNTYLMDSYWDVEPEPGLLVLFPSYLKHQAFPYDGERDRVVVSFNASVDAAPGTSFKSYDFS